MAMAQEYAQTTPARPRQNQLSEAIAYAAGQFRGFRPEIESRCYTPKSEPGQRLELILGAWKGFCKIVEDWEGRTEIYPDAAYFVATVADIHCSAEELKQFVETILPQFEGEKNFPGKAGVFISALINFGCEKRYVVRTDHISERIDFLGAYNCKHIDIMGDAGAKTGYRMNKGTIVVRGNAGQDTGCEMNRGCISVDGNADAIVGCRMKGGMISIKGRCGGYEVFRDGRGGKIYVGGAEVFALQDIVDYFQ